MRVSSLPEPPRKERYAMLKDTTVISFRQPDAIDDPLTELAREGARRMLAQALIAEADAFVALWKDVKLPDGRDRVVRHGHGPHRAIQTRRRACRGSSRQGFARDSLLEGDGFELVWGFPVSRGFFPRLAFDRYVVWVFLSEGSLFGAGKAVLRPVACDQVPGARGRGQGTETLAQLGGLPP